MIDERYRDLSVEDLRQRLFEAEETLRAIRDGEADAVVMRGGSDDKGGPDAATAPDAWCWFPITEAPRHG